jgi:hypothetical protein
MTRETSLEKVAALMLLGVLAAALVLVAFPRRARTPPPGTWRRVTGATLRRGRRCAVTAGTPGRRSLP